MMKKLCAVLLVPFMLLLFMPHSAADADSCGEYISIMLRAAACGDLEAGHAAEKCIRSTGEGCVSFDELYLLARVIYREAGSEDIPASWRQMVGEVIMNRVASPEFPNTLYDVIYQEGQYDGVGTKEFVFFTYPSKECVDLAYRLLCGERSIPSSVVFQSNYRLGEVYASFSASNHACSYLCYSPHPELY